LEAVPIGSPGSSAVVGIGEAGAEDKEDSEDLSKFARSFRGNSSGPLQKRSSSSAIA
jgi:hypothetical protein